MEYGKLADLFAFGLFIGVVMLLVGSIFIKIHESLFKSPTAPKWATKTFAILGGSITIIGVILIFLGIVANIR